MSIQAYYPYPTFTYCVGLLPSQRELFHYKSISLCTSPPRFPYLALLALVLFQKRSPRIDASR